jgi:hypothetical protein
MIDKFPGWRYGPNGQSAIFESEDDVPNGWEDHPSKVGGVAGGGVGTVIAPANSTTTAAEAAKSTEATSQTQTDPAIASASGAGGEGQSATGDTTVSPVLGAVDAHGHPYDPALHAGTGSKTKAGLWRMKVGVARPDPKAGYPLDL